MIHSKNNGFTLIEVLLATAIVAIVLTPIYSLQSSVMSRINKMTQSVQRMFVAYDFFLDAQKDDAALRQAPASAKASSGRQGDRGKEQVTKKHDDPPMDLTYEIIDMPKGSTLSKDFNNLYIEKASWLWQDTSGKRAETLLHILFEPPEPEQKNKPVSADELPRAGKDAESSDKKEDKKVAQPQQRGSRK